MQLTGSDKGDLQIKWTRREHQAGEFKCGSVRLVKLVRLQQKGLNAGGVDMPGKLAEVVNLAIGTAKTARNLGLG